MALIAGKAMSSLVALLALVPVLNSHLSMPLMAATAAKVSSSMALILATVQADPSAVPAILMATVLTTLLLVHTLPTLMGVIQGKAMSSLVALLALVPVLNSPPSMPLMAATAAMVSSSMVLISLTFQADP